MTEETPRHERGAESTAKGLQPTLPSTSSAPQPIDPKTGQHGDYWVLPEEERRKGFVRPVRRAYRHLKCGSETTMSQPIAETYARNPHYYGATFCCQCREHFPVGEAGEFEWVDDGSKVGT